MIVVAKLKAKQDQEKEVEQVLSKMVESVASEEGALMYSLHRSQSDPCTFMLYEKYKDAGALKTHSSTPHFKKMFGDLQALVDGPADIELFEELAALKKQ